MRIRVKKRNNQGFSLVELIVSLAVASIVVLAIGTLMSVGTRSYYASNSEIELQKESQIAMNQINDLLIKAITYDCIDISVSKDSISTLVITAPEEGAVIYYYVVIFDQTRNQLLFRKQTKVSVDTDPTYPDEPFLHWLEDIVAEEIGSSTSSLLAKYITKLEVIPDNLASNTQGIVQVNLELSLGGKSYSTFSTTSFRNK